MWMVYRRVGEDYSLLPPLREPSTTFDDPVAVVRANFKEEFARASVDISPPTPCELRHSFEGAPSP